jgi:hypothetical protein
MKNTLYLYQLTTTGNGGLNGRIICVPETDREEADKKAARVAAMNGCGLIRKGEM